MLQDDPSTSLPTIAEALTNELKQVWVLWHLQMLEKPRVHAHDGEHNILIRDESQLSDECVRDRLWRASDENPPEAANRAVASPKSIRMVLWNPDECHVVTILSPPCSLHADWVRDQHLNLLMEKDFPPRWRPDQ
jgi:hypothetical protein